MHPRSHCRSPNSASTLKGMLHLVQLGTLIDVPVCDRTTTRYTLRLKKRVNQIVPRKQAILTEPRPGYNASMPLAELKASQSFALPRGTQNSSKSRSTPFWPMPKKPLMCRSWETTVRLRLAPISHFHLLQPHLQQSCHRLVGQSRLPALA